MRSKQRLRLCSWTKSKHQSKERAQTGGNIGIARETSAAARPLQHQTVNETRRRTDSRSAN
jgi:hypothetical protein